MKGAATLSQDATGLARRHAKAARARFGRAVLVRFAPCVALLLLTACSSTPPVPDWQANAQSAIERAVAADLAGDARVAGAEFAAARRELTRTGRADQVALAELTRCAVRVASVDFGPCSGFESLRADASAGERAYADFLAGRLAPADAALLPPAYRALAASQAEVAVDALRAIDDPLSRLIATGVLFQQGRANPEVIALAVDTASAQGWRRPLLAWLGVQLAVAEKAGDAAAAAALKRRYSLAGGG
jgi:hypothetical protein